MTLATRTRADSPFDLDSNAAYEAWKSRKLEGCIRDAESLIVEVRNPLALTRAEREAILTRCNRNNMAVYTTAAGSNADKSIPAALAAQLGLRYLDRNMGSDDDGITSLQVVESRWRERYIPYSDRPIHWHIDGYYNGLDQQIRSLVLHCVRPAHEGGANALFDHDLAYIHLRDMDPGFIDALTAPDAMTIPPNIEHGAVVRPARSGPVFSIHGDDSLHMRYTARARNVEWKDAPLIREAVAALQSLLASDSPCIVRLTLQPGWGLICNNVLHNRSGFVDDERHPRLLYRLRYFDHID